MVQAGKAVLLHEVIKGPLFFHLVTLATSVVLSFFAWLRLSQYQICIPSYCKEKILDNVFGFKKMMPNLYISLPFIPPYLQYCNQLQGRLGTVVPDWHPCTHIKHRGFCIKKKKKREVNPGRWLTTSARVLNSFSVSLLTGPSCCVQILLGFLWDFCIFWLTLPFSWVSLRLFFVTKCSRWEQCTLNPSDLSEG